MSSKERIMQALDFTTHEPARFIPPSVDAVHFDDPVESFRLSLEAAGGEVVDVSDGGMINAASHFDTVLRVVDTTAQRADLPSDLTDTDLLIVEAKLGVAENGAVWIEPAGRYPRELLTLSEHIAVLLPGRRIVHTMHEAYAGVDISSVEYGVFMCGPSKTADIEQSLVMGAHGAVELKVFLG